MEINHEKEKREAKGITSKRNNSKRKSRYGDMISCMNFQPYGTFLDYFPYFLYPYIPYHLTLHRPIRYLTILPGYHECDSSALHHLLSTNPPIHVSSIPPSTFHLPPPTSHLPPPPIHLNSSHVILTPAVTTFHLSTPTAPPKPLSTPSPPIPRLPPWEIYLNVHYVVVCKQIVVINVSTLCN